MIDLLIDIQFIQRGFLAGILASFICPIIGSFLVVRRLSLISEALSHVTLAGVGLGVLLLQTSLFYWINPLYIGLFLAVIGALFVDQLRLAFKHYQELAIPIVLSASIGFGVLLMSMANGLNTSFLHFLFGSIVSVTKADLQFILFTSIVVLLLFLVLYKEMLSLAFDEEFAKISGIPQKWVNLIFALLVALTISIAMRVVGILLVSSLITIPVATSLRIAKSFKQVILFSIFFAQIAMISGIVLGYYLNIATGGMVVMAAILQLLIVLAIQSLISKE